MKIIHKIIVASLILAVAACKSEFEKKQAELAELKTEQEEKNAKIAKLEAYIAANDTTKKKEANVKLVSVSEIKKSDFKHFIELNGKIETDQNITVSALTGGTITRVDAKRGQRVRKGQVLGAVDNDLILRGMAELKSGMSLATIVFEKQKKLWDQQIGTEIQYLQAKNSKESLELKMESLKKQYDMSLLKSTIDGTVDEVYIKQGESIAPGMPAFRVVNTGGFKLVADVPEGYLSKVSVGNKVEVSIPDLEKTLESTIINVSDVISPNSRTFRIEIALKGDTKNYKANMLAYLKIQDFKKENSITVPINLVERQEDKDYIFVANGNKAAKREVKIGRIYRNDAEVSSGLKEGDKIITTGYQDLVDGQTIRF